MATDASFMEYVSEQATLGGRLTYRKMFGELPSQTLAACDSAPGRRAVVA